MSNQTKITVMKNFIDVLFVGAIILVVAVISFVAYTSITTGYGITSL